MNEEGHRFLNLLFNPGEEVYASPDKYSSQWNEEKGDWDLYRPSVKMEDVDTQTTVLIGINPIKGTARKDKNVTAYRSFLIEADGGSLSEQKKYVDELEVPYSACVYSGNKSLHFAVVLNRDLTDAETYRFFATWLLNIAKKADQATKNPSRGIRFPGVKRPKGKMQKLIDIKERISQDRLTYFLNKFPEKRPSFGYTTNIENIEAEDFHAIAKWVKEGMINGFDFSIGRNNRWYSIAVEFGKVGFGYEKTVSVLDNFFSPDPSFSKNEWGIAVRSGWSRGHQMRS